MNALEDVVPNAWDVLKSGAFFRQNLRYSSHILSGSQGKNRRTLHICPVKRPDTNHVHTVKKYNMLVGWLCLTSHRQRGHLETAPPFTVPCEGREAR